MNSRENRNQITEHPHYNLQCIWEISRNHKPYLPGTLRLSLVSMAVILSLGGTFPTGAIRRGSLHEYRKYLEEITYLQVFRREGITTRANAYVGYLAQLPPLRCVLIRRLQCGNLVIASITSHVHHWSCSLRSPRLTRLRCFELWPCLYCRRPSVQPQTVPMNLSPHYDVA